MNIYARLSTVLLIFVGLPVALSSAEELSQQRMQSLQGSDLEAAERIDRDIRYFASEELKGRGVGTPEIAQAAEFIAKRFASLGLRTELIDSQPFQSLAVDSTITVGDPAKNHVQIDRQGAGPLNLQLGKTFNPLALGSSGQVQAPLAFVGYGITAPQANYDDYAGLDVQGKIVIVLRKEPRLGEPNNPLGKTSPTPAAYFSTKMSGAIAHGAVGVIVVNDHASAIELGKQDDSNTEDALLEVTDAGNGSADKKLPTVCVSRAVIDGLLQQSMGRSLLDIEQSIDRDFRPISGLLPGVTASIQTDLQTDKVMARNVIAELPGSGSLAEETVIVGAHYDHVGMGGIGSLAPGTIAVHNGADDNASGTAALLEIARQLSQSQEPQRRRIVFIAFTGEERGLLGSAHYVRNPRFGLEQTVAMLNLDMVGRLKGNVLSVYGTGTAENFDALIRQLNEKSQFSLDIDPSGYGPSDHQSFYEKDIPVLHFFTGLHNDYHRPSDDFDKINLIGLTRITDMVTEATREIATESQRPVFQTTRRGKGIRKQKTAFLGVQLRMSDDRVTIVQVVPDGPAAQAGLMVGDALIQAGDQNLTSIQTVLDYLAGHVGGETLEFQVLRQGQPRSVKAILGEKK
ncbi:Aminopeptidase YwaD precursor [Rosistilla carotiformis]|uniref:Aminopeptidase YwaD n=1 Tax=Rosistilla carotiformis TaxID=2528017 RepID=A0A518K0T3_9BACT|nr:M20/M25/M40 family metallo-hydrolase [Rosistilla carotiformis]QDV71406.1 Aminopeptidase YwaD precursor [Rosistilla carotiformis]